GGIVQRLVFRRALFRSHGPTHPRAGTWSRALMMYRSSTTFPAGKLVEERYIMSARDQVPARGWFGQWGHLTLSQHRQCLPPNSPDRKGVVEGKTVGSRA